MFRISFPVDAALLALSAFGWRAVMGWLDWLVRPGEERASGDGWRIEPRCPASAAVGIARYRELLKNLVFKDLKLKYRGSVFGFFWSLANPLLMVATYTVAFHYILRVRTEGFVFNLLLGLLNWTFFANSAMMSTESDFSPASIRRRSRSTPRPSSMPA